MISTVMFDDKRCLSFWSKCKVLLISLLLHSAQSITFAANATFSRRFFAKEMLFFSTQKIYRL